MNITLSANEKTFSNKFDYIASSEGSSKGIIISFSIFAGLCLVLAIVAMVMTKLTGGRSNSRDELLEQHMENDD